MENDNTNAGDEIARAAEIVEDAIRALGPDPASVRMKTPLAGRGWSLMRGSAAVAIFVRPPHDGEGSPMLRVVSPIVRVDPARADALYHTLLELNARGLGPLAFGLQGDVVVLVSERPMRDLVADELRYVLDRMGAVADHYDDELTKRFGGARVSDRA